MKEIYFRTTYKWAYSKQMIISYIISMKYVKIIQIIHNLSVVQTMMP